MVHRNEKDSKSKPRPYGNKKDFGKRAGGRVYEYKREGGRRKPWGTNLVNGQKIVRSGK